MTQEKQLTAKEAAQIASDRRVTVILGQIKDAATMGRNSLNVNHHLTPVQVDELKNLGYDVQFFQHLGGFAISW